MVCRRILSSTITSSYHPEHTQSVSQWVSQSAGQPVSRILGLHSSAVAPSTAFLHHQAVNHNPGTVLPHSDAWPVCLSWAPMVRLTRRMFVVEWDMLTENTVPWGHLQTGQTARRWAGCGPSWWCPYTFSGSPPPSRPGRGSSHPSPKEWQEESRWEGINTYNSGYLSEDQKCRNYFPTQECPV